MSITRPQLIVCAEVDAETPDRVDLCMLVAEAVTRGQYVRQSFTPQEALVLAGELIAEAAAVLGVDRAGIDQSVERIVDIIEAAVEASPAAAE